MKIFLVGGAVRDEIMGIVPKDRDYVVVGATPQEMIDAGFHQVGADFPVFLHPETNEEYALARSEKSTGKGYHDFEVTFDPSVTLTDDLYRRDLTINAVAKDIVTGEIIDPFNGIDDMCNRVLKNVNRNSFVDDPVRILRLARFAARFPSFTIPSLVFHDASLGDISNAKAERVATEMLKALKEIKPSVFFRTLLHIGQTAWFKELFDLVDIEQPLKWHAEGDAFEHTMLVLDSAARYREPVEIVFGALVHDFGKAVSKNPPSHRGHEKAGVPLVQKFCNRLKLSNNLSRIGSRSAEFHRHVHTINELTAKTKVKTYYSFKAHIHDAHIVSRVAFHDNEGKLPFEPGYTQGEIFVNNMLAIHAVKLSSLYDEKTINGFSIERRKQELDKLRRKAVE